MTYADMWKACARAALMLDAAPEDWRTLSEVEETLRPLATELADATAESAASVHRISGVRSAVRDVGMLKSCLTWVRYHIYDALETELRNQLDAALRCAMRVLDGLENGQRQRVLAPADTRFEERSGNQWT